MAGGGQSRSLKDIIRGKADPLVSVPVPSSDTAKAKPARTYDTAQPKPESTYDTIKNRGRNIDAVIDKMSE